MPAKPVSLKPQSQNLFRNGGVVGITDRIYPIKGKSVIFDEVLVKGDLTAGPLDYNGKQLRVSRVDSAIGLLVDNAGARGPVWKHVECQVIA